MKNKIILIGILFLISNMLEAQTQEIIDGQVVNKTDENHLKQGLWILFYDSDKKQISSKGNYVDNRKQGVWTEYYRNGNMKSSITYKDNNQDGYVKLYYEDGTLSEEGIWKINKWVGEYKYFRPSGQIAYEWEFDEEGRRTGEQKYYYESGKLRISGYWENGKESGNQLEYYDSGRLRSESQWKDGITDGLMKEYYENGNLHAELVYNEGIFDPGQSKIYDKTKQNKIENVVKTEVKVEEPKQPDNGNNLERFAGSGFHKIYDTEKRIIREGNFLNGVFISGKRYYYNSKGEVVKTAIYENGRIVKVQE
ncbi:MAG: hypothetical protein MJ211_02475 [Bacteroidales bacterium]|nr:hypothetical protein [Bacteroidales bacterium]